MRRSKRLRRSTIEQKESKQDSRDEICELCNLWDCLCLLRKHKKTQKPRPYKVMQPYPAKSKDEEGYETSVLWSDGSHSFEDTEHFFVKYPGAYKECLKIFKQNRMLLKNIKDFYETNGNNWPNVCFLLLFIPYWDHICLWFVHLYEANWHRRRCKNY